MTWVGLDVHARSTHGSAVNSLTGELDRVRFGPRADPVVAWLTELPGPARAVDEAGPTGFGLQRAAHAAGIAMQVVAPGTTPRAAADRVKTDRKDAELLAPLLLAGQLTPVWDGGDQLPLVIEMDESEPVARPEASERAGPLHSTDAGVFALRSSRSLGTIRSSLGLCANGRSLLVVHHR